MPKPTSADSRVSGAAASGALTAMRVTIVTMDTHLATATGRARARLMKQLPGLSLTMHAASEWANDEKLLHDCVADIEQADWSPCSSWRTTFFQSCPL